MKTVLLLFVAVAAYAQGNVQFDPLVAGGQLTYRIMPAPGSAITDISAAAGGCLVVTDGMGPSVQVGIDAPATVACGGTGAVTLTDHGVLLGQGTDPVAATSAGTADQCLLSNGAAADPAFEDGCVIGPASATATALPRYDGTTGKLIQDSNITSDGDSLSVPGTIGLGASPPACTGGTAGAICMNQGTAPDGEAGTWNMYSLSADDKIYVKIDNGAAAEICTATIGVACGGTGATTLTNHGVVLGQGASAVAVTSAGSAGQCLLSGGASADPAFDACPGGTSVGDLTTLHRIDEFWARPSAGGYGDMGWTAIGATNDYEPGSSTYPVPGWYRGQASTVNGVGGAHLGGAGFADPPIYTPNAITGTFIFSIRIPGSGNAESNMRFGIAASAGDQPTDYIYIEHVNNSACTYTGSDSNWFLASRAASGTPTRVDTTVAFTAGNRVNLRLRSLVAGTWLASVATYGGAWSSEVSVNATIPTATLAPIAEVVSCDTNPHSMAIDRFEIYMDGIAR